MLFLENLKQVLSKGKIKSSKCIEREMSLKTIAEIPLGEKKNLIELISNESDKTQTYKAFKKLITNIQFLCINKIIDKKVMLITSPRKEEGKSYVAANMAISFAKIGKKVLIIDANLEKGRQDKIFNVPNNLGLSNYLSNIDSNGVEINEFLSKYINETAIKNINLITSGIVPPNPDELLALPKFQELLKDAKVFFDIIIIDSAEILNKTEALLLTKNVTSTLIVVSQKKTSLKDLKRTQKDIHNAGGNILGIILNEVKLKKEKKTKKQRKEELRKLKLKVKEKINCAIQKIKKRTQDANQKLLEEPKNEKLSRLESKFYKNVKEKIVVDKIVEKGQKDEQRNRINIKDIIIKNSFVETIKKSKKAKKKECEINNEPIDIDKNQLSIFDDSSSKKDFEKNNRENKDNKNKSKKYNFLKKKIITINNNSAEKFKHIKTNLKWKAKAFKEKIGKKCNTFLKKYINKFDDLKCKIVKVEKKYNNKDNNNVVEKTNSNTIISNDYEIIKEVNEEETLKDESLKKEKKILIVVDAENGCCRVFSKDYFAEKQIRGFDKIERTIKAHYSSKNLKMKQEYFVDRYQITETQAKKIDVLIYDTLKDYDEYFWSERKVLLYNAENYALCISKEFEKESSETDEEFYIRCQRQRKLKLEEANLEIIYKLDNLWKNNKIRIFDKIQLRKFARLYEIKSTMKKDSEIEKNVVARKFYDDIISGAEKRLEKSKMEDEKRAVLAKQVIEEDKKIKQEQLKFEQKQFELEKRAAQERIKLEKENMKAERKAETERLREVKRKEHEVEKIERKEESVRRRKEKQKQKEDAKFQKERERVKQREEAKIEEELLVDNLYPKTKYNKNL